MSMCATSAFFHLQRICEKRMKRGRGMMTEVKTSNILINYLRVVSRMRNIQRTDWPLDRAV